MVDGPRETDDEADALLLLYPHLTWTKDAVRVRLHILRRGTVRPELGTGSTVADIVMALAQGITRMVFGKDQHTVLMLAEGYKRQKRLYPSYLAALRDGASLETEITTRTATESGFRPTLLSRLRRRRSAD